MKLDLLIEFDLIYARIFSRGQFTQREWKKQSNATPLSLSLQKIN